MRLMGICPECGMHFLQTDRKEYGYLCEKGVVRIQVSYSSCPDCGEDKRTFEEVKENIEKFLKEKENGGKKICRQQITV